MDSDTHMQKQSKQSSRTVWHGVFVAMACFALGFLGGWVALQASNTAKFEDATPSQQVVLRESEAIADVVETVRPSVVSIGVTAQAGATGLFGEAPSQRASEGTGIILSEDGLVVTNKHVIPANATNVTVVLNDGTQYENVEVIGRDPFNDIAFLRIADVDNLQPAELGDSEEARVGDKVIAIGNALGQFENTVTSGIVSGLGRPIVAGTGADAESLQNLMQTDAAINPGNSGGPLVNINGEVIGINTAVAGGGAQNIGFAIPIDDVKSGITSVENNGELVRPYLGVRYITLTPAIAEELNIDVESGALIRSSDNQPAVINNSPADKAGLENGDIITSINNVEVNDDNQLVTLVSRYQVGETIDVVYLRDGQEQTVNIELEAVPDTL